MSDTSTPIEDEAPVDPVSLIAEADEAVAPDDTDDRFAEMAASLAAEFEARSGAAPTVDDEDPEPVSVEMPAEAAETPLEAPVPAAEPEPGLSGILTDLGLAERDAAEVLRWAASLSDEQVQRINSALLVDQSAPSGAPTAASGHGEPAAAPPAAGSDVPPAQGQPGMPIRPPDLGALSEFAPELGTYLEQQAQLLSAQQQQIVSFQQAQAEQARREAEAAQSQAQVQIEAGEKVFRDTYAWASDEDVQAIARRAASLQVMPALVQQHGGAVDKAFVAAMETALWSDPSYRDRLVQQRVNEFAETQQQTTERRRKASALTSGGGSVSRAPQQAAPADMTPEQRREAMARTIAQSIADR
jgi:hypothetical protein